MSSANIFFNLNVHAFVFLRYGFALGFLYTKNYFDEEAKKVAEELVIDVKREVTKSLLWLDKSSQ